MFTSRLAAAALALTTIATAGAAGAEPEVKGTPVELQKFLRTGTHQVTLVGQARDSVQADAAQVTVIVKTQAKELAAALTANAEQRGAFAQLLEREGIAPKSIRTGRFSASPQYGWFGKAPSSYEVVNRMRVRIADERELTVLARAADQSDEISIGQIEFEYTDRSAFQEKVRQTALDDALSKKRFYEERLGTTLRPVQFQFSDSGPLPTRGALELGQVMVTGARIGGDADGGALLRQPTALPPSFDELQYEISVNVTFELGPAPAAR